MTRSNTSFSNHENAATRMAARNLAFIKAREEFHKARLKTLKRLLIGLCIITALAVLWGTQRHCEATSSNPAACTD